jgi:hypothetical protein
VTIIHVALIYTSSAKMLLRQTSMPQKRTAASLNSPRKRGIFGRKRPLTTSTST